MSRGSERSVSPSEHTHPSRRSQIASNSRSRSRSRDRHRRRSPSPKRHRSRSRSRDRRRSRERRHRRRSYSRSVSRRRYSRSPPRHRRDRDYDDRSYRRRSPPRGRGPVYRGTEDERKSSTCLFIGNLPYELRERDITDIFGVYGTITHVKVPIDGRTGDNKGFAFVEYESRGQAEAAFDKFNGHDLEGRRLRLDWDVGTRRKENITGYFHSSSRRDSRSPAGRGRSPSVGRRSVSPRGA